MRRQFYFAMFSTLVASLYLSGCGKKEQAEAPPLIKPVKIHTVSGSTGVKLEYPGQVSAALASTLAFEVQGKLVSFPVVEGQEVKKGDILAQLDLRDLDSNLSAAKSSYEEAQSNLARATELVADNFISKMDFDRVRATENEAQSNFNKAQKAYDDGTLRAPFDGMVAKKIVDDFSNIVAKQSVLLLHDIHNLEVVINIPESDWAKVRQINRATMNSNPNIKPLVEIAGFPGKFFSAKIKEVSTSANPTTRTYAIKLSFNAGEGNVVLPGMTAKAFITSPSEDGTFVHEVPAKAVAADSHGASYVWLVDTQTMQVSKQVVTVGQMKGKAIEVLSGLETGQHIASSGVHQLKEGVTVRRFQ